MRFFGLNVRFFKPVMMMGAFLCSLALGATPALGQAAPYVLPYTMTTYAGPLANYTAGQPCANGVGVALDVIGDGCMIPGISIGIDPHDIRVDGQGNVYWIDNQGGGATGGVIHKISPVSLVNTIYQGSLISASAHCKAGDKYGDGCSSTDGAANATPLTAQLKLSRGIGLGPNGDLLIAGYNDNYDHKIAASSGVMSIVMGTGSSGYLDTAYTQATVNGTRGITEDVNGNIYVADSGNNAVRVIYSGYGQIPPVFQYTGGTSTSPVTPVAGQTYSLTAPNTAGTKSVGSGIPANTALVSTPEDVHVDTNGNIYISDFGNALVRAIYMGKGTLPGIASPQYGYIYTIAGCNALNCTAVPYPTDGTNPTVPATTVGLSLRKMDIDLQNNIYIADSSENVVWFVDHATGYIRVLAGNFGATAGANATGCPAQTDTRGDGCPATQAAIYTSVASNASFGVSADNIGNLYLTDNEGAGNTAGSRLRKIVSGLNFPATAISTPVTQTIDLHFAPGDTSVAANYTLSEGTTDYVLGTPSCTLRADTTTDCTLAITFTPSQPGKDNTVLTVTSALGATANFKLTGIGSGSAVTFDPGNIALAPGTYGAAQGLVLDTEGNAYIADTSNNRIVRLASDGTATVFAGTGTSGYTGDGGLASAATLNGPRAVAVDTSGSVYIADTGNNVIRKVSASGVISTYAGGAATVCPLAYNALGDGCPALQATFNAPTGIAADNLGQIYVADTGNNLIRQIGTNTNVTTLGGGGTPCTGKLDTLGDGCGATAATFSGPTGLALDAAGQYLYIADTGDNDIRRIYLASTISVATPTSYTVVMKPVTLVAGIGQAGKSIDASQIAINTQLNGPTGVAVDGAGNVYIADTANDAVRLVNSSTGTITTIVGILGSSGAGTVPGSAVVAQLASPASVAVSPSGNVTILDTGNNRILTDVRSQVSFNFGAVNTNSDSAIQNFTETNIGNTAVTFASPLLTPSGESTQFSVTPGSNTNGTISGCSGTLASGGVCNIQAEFTPTGNGRFTATYTEDGTGAAGAAPSITVSGLGGVLTPTQGTVAQTVPATGNSQFGGTVTLTATITAPTCNTAAPSCSPSGTVSFIVDGTATAPVTLGANGTASQVQQGLSVGNHTVSCSYSGDDFYASSSCTPTTITVSSASTTSMVTALPNNQPQFPTTNCILLTQPATLNGDLQCTATTFTTTVLSNTSGSPTGTVTFYATGGALGNTPVSLGSSALDPVHGTAAFSLTYITDPNHSLVSNSTLAPGTYSITCSYSGSTNFAASPCAPVTLVVAPQTADFTLVTRGCAAGALYVAGTSTPGEGVACNPGPETFANGVPVVAVAQGSTTDATIFVNASNTLSGTLTISCSGLPANSTCTFAPTSIALTPAAGYTAPLVFDMTLWTDLQPGAATSSLAGPSFTGHGRLSWAASLGWPLTILGFAGIIGFRRRRSSFRSLSLLALLLTVAGSSMIFTGCGTGGPGVYKAQLTPAGTYPITVTVTNGTVSHTTVVNWKVTGPGIAGQE